MMNTLTRPAAMMCGLLLAAAAIAQSDQGSTATAPPTRVAHGQEKASPSKMVFSADYLTDHLNLDQEQSRKLAQLETAYNKRFAELEKLVPALRIPEQEKLSGEHNQQIRRVLTPEQNKTLKAMEAEALKPLLEKEKATRAANGRE